MLARQKGIMPVLFCTILLDVIGLAMVFPIVPYLLTDPTSHSFMLAGWSKSSQYFIAGIATAIYGVMQFIASPIMGELSDLYGRKKVLLIGVSVLALSQMIFGFAVIAGSLAILLISRAVGGVAGGNFAIAQAIIADISTPENRAKNFGLIGAAFGVGFILGPVISGEVVAWTHSYSAPFFVAAMLGLCNALVVSLILKETHHVRREGKMSLFKGVHNIRQALSHGSSQDLYLSSLFTQLGFGCFIAYVGVLLANQFGFKETDIGYFFAFIGIWIFIAQAFLLRFVTMYKERHALMYTLPLVGIGIVAYPFVLNPAMVYMIAPIGAVANPISNALIISRISRSTTADKQGAALGINASLVAFSQGVGPLVAGWSALLLGVSAPFVLGAFCMLVATYFNYHAR